MSDSIRPYGQQPTRLLCPQDSLGKNTGVGCHFLLQGDVEAQEIWLNPSLTTWDTDCMNIRHFLEEETTLPEEYRTFVLIHYPDLVLLWPCSTIEWTVTKCNARQCEPFSLFITFFFKCSSNTLPFKHLTRE